MTPDTIRATRALLRENTATFGQRFAVSPRTVEDWEQGRRTPRGLTARVLAQLATRHARQLDECSCDDSSCAVCRADNDTTIDVQE